MLRPTALATAALLVGLLASEAHAQNDSQCSPTCSAGYICISGTCTYACDGPCPTGQQCTSVGSCAPTAGAPSSAQPAAAPALTPSTVPPAAAPAPPPATSATPAPTQEPPSAPPPTPVAEPTPAAPPPAVSAAPTPASDGTTTDASEQPEKTAVGTVNMNAAGFITFGPTLGLEFGGHHFSIKGQLRSLALGVLSRFVLPLLYASDGEFDSGFGAGVIARWYSGGSGYMRGAYVGGGLEYVSLTIVDQTGDTQYVADDVAIIPQVHAGYRWVPGKFVFAIGGELGYGINTESEIRPRQEGSLNDARNDKENLLFATATVELGFMF